MTPVPPDVLSACSNAQRVVVLTGAGASADSGLATFRDPDEGLWQRFDPMELASVEGWRDDPELVWAWYLWRFERGDEVQPNAGHRALAQWAQHARLVVITQNIDDLHEQAGSSDVVHLHGALSAFRCSECDRPYAGTVTPPTHPVERLAPPHCTFCGGFVRPGVVWFGEALPQDAIERAFDEVERADLVLSVGTSGVVTPAALLPRQAFAAGIPLVEINPNDTEISDLATAVWRERSAVALPALVEALHGVARA